MLCLWKEWSNVYAVWLDLSNCQRLSRFSFGSAGREGAEFFKLAHKNKIVQLLGVQAVPRLV